MPRLKNLEIAWEYIRRNKWLTATNILVMSLTFFLTSVFVIAAYGSNFILDALEQRPQVTAYFKDEATEIEILAIKEKLEATGLTSEVKYVSKEEALNIFMGLSQKNPALLEGISANVLPASLEVRAKNLNDLSTMAQMLEGESLLEDLQFFRDVVEKFRRLSDAARLLGLGMISLLTVVSVLIVLITISITIASRGEEIEIMRLVGASDWQIRGPFLFQGAILGVISALLSLVLTFALFPLMRPQLVGALGSLPVPQLSLTFSAGLVLGEVFLGMLIGSFGSWVAVRKYLKA